MLFCPRCQEQVFVGETPAEGVDQKATESTMSDAE
jgi:uncharacterized Zn finger protein (UPF0148 family)